MNEDGTTVTERKGKIKPEIKMIAARMVTSGSLTAGTPQENEILGAFRILDAGEREFILNFAALRMARHRESAQKRRSGLWLVAAAAVPASS
jgi:hypothetical protein